NNNGIIAWNVDIAEGAGGHYIVAYDMKAKKHTIVARPGDAAPGGGTYGDGPAPFSRMLADINDLNQVSFNIARAGSDGNDPAAVFIVTSLTDVKQGRLVASFGTKTVEGTTLQEAWFSDTNNSSQVSFT